MQDVQNIPNPDVNSTDHDDEFGNHSGVEQIRDENDEGKIPLPDDEPKPAPIEEPPDTEITQIDEDNDMPQRIL